MAPIQETPEAKGEVEGMTSTGAACPVCGKPRSEWIENKAHGFKRDGLEYCSQACLKDGAKTKGIDIGPSSHGCL